MEILVILWKVAFVIWVAAGAFFFGIRYGVDQTLDDIRDAMLEDGKTMDDVNDLMRKLIKTRKNRHNND